MIASESLDITAFKSMLEEERQELVLKLGIRVDIRAERAPDPVDDVELALECDVASAQLERDSKVLQAVDAALGRIRTGSYGCCVTCGAIIPEARLRSIPWTPHCMRCQEAVDRGGNGNGFEGMP